MTVAEAIDPEPLLRHLHIVPDPDRANLARLAGAPAEISATPAERGDFHADEFPMDETDIDDLAAGGNFRLDRQLGPLDVMQWVAGIDADDLYRELEVTALAFKLDEIPLRCCGLAHLRAMKEAAGRPRDLDDLEHLPPVGTA